MPFVVNLNSECWWIESSPYTPDKTLAYYKDTGLLKASETRYPSKRRKKPSGDWLYPTKYEVRRTTKRSNGGEIVFHPQAIRYVDGKPVWYAKTSRQAPYPNCVFLGALPNPDNNMRDKVVVKALLKLKDQRVDLSVALGEYKETARFVGGGFTSLGNSILNFKAGNFKKALSYLGVKGKKQRKALKRRMHRDRYKQRSKNEPRRSQFKKDLLEKNKVSNKWLEWQYAAKPLMGEIDGACKALQLNDELTDWVTTVKAVVKREIKESKEYNSTDLNLFASDNEIETSLGYFVRLDFTPSNTFLSVLSSAGATNPLSTLYELTRLSFVLDWAVGIGDWLSAMDATLGYRFLSGSITQRRLYREHVRGASRPLNWQKFYARDPGPVRRTHNAQIRTLEIVRTPYTSVPFPLPVYKSPVSLSHVASGLALLTTAIGRK